MFPVHLKSMYRGSFHYSCGISEPLTTTPATKKSLAKRQALGKTTCKSRTSSSSEVVRAFSPLPKANRGETRGRLAPDAPGQSPTPSRGPRPAETLTWRTRALSTRPLHHPPDFQTGKVWGRGSLHFHFTTGGQWALTRPPALNPEQSLEPSPRRNGRKTKARVRRRTSPKPENGAAGSARSARRAGPGRTRPGALGSRGSGRRASAPGAARARWEARGAPRAGDALTVAFCLRRSLRQQPLSAPAPRLLSPHARSCAPRRARRFLAPPSTPRLARRRGERRRALREPREGRAAAQLPPAGPASCPACGDGLRPAPPRRAPPATSAG